MVPLTDRARSLGALVLGRARRRYEEADEELAGVLGRFISRLVVKAPLDRQNPEASVPLSEPDREWADEPQLTGS